MKKLFILLLVLGIRGIAGAQTSSYDYMKAICDRITTMDRDMTQRFGDTLAVRRVETGVLSQGGGGLTGFTERTLYAGKTYVLYVFTDRRVSNLKMNIYAPAGNEWRLTQTVDKNESTNRSAGNMYGDYELYVMKPDTTAKYKVEIAAPAGDASAARYGMIIWSKEIASSEDGSGSSTNSGTGSGSQGSSGSTYFSTDKKNTCFWDAQQRQYRNCQEENASTLFVLNANKTMFKHTTDQMVSAYYVQHTEYDNANKLMKYDVVSDAGNKYTFMVRDDGSNLTIFCDKGDNSYIVQYSIRRRWSD
ncbi:MAG TPA: hypothetical protein VHC96_09220 [Puia sp.]|nr:hypothetical protein [Puia sp.]